MLPLGECVVDSSIFPMPTSADSDPISTRKRCHRSYICLFTIFLRYWLIDQHIFQGRGNLGHIEKSRQDTLYFLIRQVICILDAYPSNCLGDGCFLEVFLSIEICLLVFRRHWDLIPTYLTPFLLENVLQDADSQSTWNQLFDTVDYPSHIEGHQHRGPLHGWLGSGL